MVLEGVAVADPSVGEVVKLAMKPAKLPMFADAMRMEIEYENRTEAGRNISRFLLAGAGGILFIKRLGSGVRAAQDGASHAEFSGASWP